MIGDRPFAIFDGPARAIGCPIAISEYGSRMGVDMCAGLDTGECDMVDGKVGGIAADIGAHVANQTATAARSARPGG